MRYLVALLLTGCASVNGGPNMNVDQLKAVIADKNAQAVCTKISGPWGTGKVVVINLDETRINGTVTVEGDCDKMSATTIVPPKPVPATAPTPAPVAP